ncbi:bifunctional 3-(3-hydroxy-phenyl)propionate/3-hydroxycinnamic acid hydroxylase [Pseudonocardia sp. CA-107938]|uniref:bifunctional 3-(3-hydroxy-phenyl)propionate/3-hydroxycinnamic acid hydroxylase n=1 Tax=Pseudonocardia sp. CA-107938 TaxID=3240021 RepID=UPI003D8A116D
MRTRVAVVGAGPVGATVANALGQLGVETVLLDRETEIIDYPRAAGMDDECLRTIQGIDLHEQVLRDVVQNVPLRMFDAAGRCFADIRPSTREFGWYRRNIFLQPQLERVLRAGLARYPHVTFLPGHEVVGLTQDADGVELTVDGLGTVRADHVVAADGGRSPMRELLGIPLVGATHPRKWVVIDALDQRGAVCTGLHCDARRPYVSAHLPRGLRRWEFMLHPGEDAAPVPDREQVRALLAQHVPDADTVDVIRARVYTHHSRLASTFVRGRVALAGDAAHLMPPWAGQGLNTGMRDATNLAWKLALISKGHAGHGLLQTYDDERRAHAAAMIDLSTTLGRILAPSRPVYGRLRDVAVRASGHVPGVKDWVLQMRFKPMPHYRRGVVLEPDRDEAVGRMFPQPLVEHATGEVVRLDDVLGDGFAVIGHDQDPTAVLDADTVAYLTDLGTRFVAVGRSRSRPPAVSDRCTAVEDVEGVLTGWFEHRPPIAVVRPDRYLAALTDPAGLGSAVARLRTILEGTA